MVAQKGRLLLIEVESVQGSGTYVPVGGLRTKSLKINNEPVDCSNDDSAGIRKLLEGAGIRSIEASGSGLISDTLGFDVAREAAEENEHIKFRVTVPGDTYSRVYVATWMVSECEQSGEYKDAAQFKLTLMSDGDITKTRIGA